jgi:hypothetical protein
MIHAPRRFVAVLLVVTAIAANPAAAADLKKIRTINIGAQALMTLVSGAIQGKVRSGRDVVRCLAAGSVAGYGFYEAKVMIRDGNVQTGWLTANVAGSLSENAAAGKHPLAQVGYSIGPLRIRLSIPRFDPGADAYAFVDISEYETVTLIQAFEDHDRIRFRSGLIAFERDTLYPVDDDSVSVVGVAWGIYPGVWTGADRSTWHHEVIHAVQALQGDAVEPSFPIFTYTPRRPDQRKRIIRFEHLKLGTVNFANDLAIRQQRYEERWTEIEANRIAEDEEP